MWQFPSAIVAVMLVTGYLLVDAQARREGVYTSAPFHGAMANSGTVNHLYENGKRILRVSKDFQTPDAPAPTWRVVDSKGNIFTLDAFKSKAGEKRQVEVPAHVGKIAKVQVYCAYSEALLGETSFATPVP
jgi:hypothetical protein